MTQFYRFIVDGKSLSDAVHERGFAPPDSIDLTWQAPQIAFPNNATYWWTEDGLDHYITSGLQEWECGLFPRNASVLIANTDRAPLYSDSITAIFAPDTPVPTSKMSVDAFMEQLGGVSAKDKAVAYVTRERNGIKELLVFKFAEEPEIPPMVPGGGVDEGETPIDALKRELWEESGISAYTARKLCEYTFYKLYMKQYQRRHVYEVIPLTPLPDTWIHTVTGSGDDASYHFHYEWIPVDQAEGLLGARLADKVHLL